MDESSQAAINGIFSFPNLASTYCPDGINPKVLYRENFLSVIPDRDKASEALSSLLLIDESAIDSAFYQLHLGEESSVDENLFTCLWLFLSCSIVTESEISFLRRLAASPCPKCKRLSQSVSFLDESGSQFVSRCAPCRGSSIYNGMPPVLFTRALFVETVPISLLYQWHSMTFRGSSALKLGYICSYSGGKDLFPNTPIAEFAKFIKSGFESIEKYEYVTNRKRENSMQFYCSQRSLRADSSEQAKRRKRMRETKKNHKCGGSITVLLSVTESIVIRASHESHHEEAGPKIELTSDDVRFIEKSAMEGLAPFQVCGMLQKRSRRIFSWSQVYYRWCEVMKQQFMRNQNPFISCRLLLETCENLSQCFYNAAPYALGFVTAIGKRLTLAHECAEAFIDSTYKTNSSKLELFGVLTTVFGTGFPIAYLFLQINADGVEGPICRQTLITGFLSSVQAQLPNFKPKLFFTDKDHGQMNSIRTVFNMYPSLCLWHMKRAIKFKIRDIRKTSTRKMTEADEKRVLDLVSKHYNMHPYLCPGLRAEDIRDAAMSDIAYMLSDEKTASLYEYLIKHWYEPEKFKTWGRRNEKDGIPFTRTTMMVESHWSLLKRHYLILHNRPRVDFITHLINTFLMVKFENDYKMLSIGSKKPVWWKAFAREWQDLSTRQVNQIYYTDVLSWKCSCPAFLMSRFLICKHLISSSSLPVYRDVVRSRHPPFLAFLREENRHYANLEPFMRTARFEAPHGTDLRSDMLLPSPIESPVQAVGRAENASFIKKEMEWVIRHVEELEKTQAGSRQILHIKNYVLPRISAYRTNVEKEMASRGTPATWGNSDTLYLP